MSAVPAPARDEVLAGVRARLHAFIARRVESAEAAHDLTQEVLLRLVAHAGDYFGELPRWLYRVARNVVVDHYRARAGASPTPAVPLSEREPAGPVRRPVRWGSASPG